MDISFFQADRTEDHRLSVATASSAHPDTAQAVADIVTALMAGRDRLPDFVSVHHGASRAAHDLWSRLGAAFGAAALHGATSCQGVMTDRGILDGTDDAIGVFAIWNRSGAYGSAMEAFGTSARAAARKATQSALQRAGRPGEVPEMIWIAPSPGQEEDVLDGIKDVVGNEALIVGGSAADSRLTGAWSVFSTDGVSREGIVVSVLFPSTPLACVYASGYAPTDRRGIVTATRGRSILEIDSRPAAEVYRDWRDDPAFDPAAERSVFLLQSALAPLGRKQREIDGIGTFLMAHPAGTGADGSLDLFSTVSVGEEVCLMAGSSDGLVQRAGRIARESRDRLGPDGPAGALVVYCGGCMMAIRDRMPEVVAALNASLGGAPFLGVFSFGEQGELPEQGARHANLMISCSAFAARADGTTESR